MKLFLWTAAEVAVLAGIGFGQEVDVQQGPGGPGVRNGLHLYEVSVSTGASFFDGVTVNGSTPGACNCYTLGSATAGYSYNSGINGFNVAYTPSFWDRFGSGGFHSFDQNLRFSYESRFRPKWTFSLTGSGNDSSVEQLLFLPSLSPSALAPGSSTADQLGSFVTSTLTPGTPAATLLYGGRILTFGGRAAITYRPSSRLRISVAGGEYEAQTRKDGAATATTIVDVVPRTRYDEMELDLGYSLTPRTEIGTEISTLTYHTVFGDYRTVLTEGSYARKLSPHWMTLIEGGVGTYTPLQSTLRGAGASFVGAANLAYQGPRNSFLFGYQRSLGDVYGVAASSTEGFQSTWKWRMPGRNWSTYVTLGRQRLTGGAVIAAATNWEATAGVTRPLTQRVWMSLSYGYVMDALAPAVLYNSSLSANVVRLTVFWTPIVENQPTGGPLD
jgi:hypothetical protein